VKRLTRYVVGAMGLLAAVGTIVMGVHLSLPQLPPQQEEGSDVPRERWKPAAATIDDVLAARHVSLAEDATLEQVLQESVGWAERVDRVELSLASYESAGSFEEAKRRAAEGCKTITTALLNAVRRSEPWSAPLAALSKTTNALAREGPARLELLQDLQSNILRLQAALPAQAEASTRFAQLLDSEQFLRLVQLVESSPLLRSVCALEAAELERRYASEMRLARAEAEHDVVPAEEWNHVAEVVGAFLELELLTLPAPERCELPSEQDFEWVPEALGATAKALKQLPLATVKRLRDLDEERLTPMVRQVSRTLPIAACEKVTQLLCSHLKRSRLEQRDTASIAALRARARSLAAAHESLVRLARESRAHGCETLGGVDADTYALRLVTQGHALALDGAPRLAERIRRFSVTSARGDEIREQVLEELRLQRMEIAAVGLGVVGPGLRYLAESGKPLDSTSAAWTAVLLTIEGRENARGGQLYTESGLQEFERLLSLLLTRNNELCELATSSSVSAILGDRVGVFYELGRALISELAQRCRES
jgi:hypothetical protein